MMGTGSTCREKDPIPARGRTVVFSLTDEQGAGELEGQSHGDVRMPVIWFTERMGVKRQVAVNINSLHDFVLKF